MPRGADVNRYLPVLLLWPDPKRAAATIDIDESWAGGLESDDVPVRASAK